MTHVINTTDYGWPSTDYVTCHAHLVSDTNGEIVDIVTFCSDTCHQRWTENTGNKYDGWYGCQDTLAPATCASCGKVWGE